MKIDIYLKKINNNMFILSEKEIYFEKIIEIVQSIPLLF